MQHLCGPALISIQFHPTFKIKKRLKKDLLKSPHIILLEHILVIELNFVVLHL